MGISEIESHSALVSKIQNLENSYLLLYKSGTDNSECALKNLTKASAKMEKANIFLADVSKVRDIHTVYNISSAPSLLEFNKDLKVRRSYQGESEKVKICFFSKV